MEKQPFKKSKTLSFLAPFISKDKRADIFNFLSVKYFNKRLSFLKVWHICIWQCWNYRPSNLLFRFTRHRLQQPKNRQKTAVNLLIHLFHSYHWKKCPVKVSSFLTLWTENNVPLNFMQNWTEKIFYWQFFPSLGMIWVMF